MKPEMGEFIQTRSRGVLGPAMCTLPETSPVTQHLCLLGTLLVGFELELSGPRGGIAQPRGGSRRASLLFRSPVFCCFWASLSEKTFEFRIKSVASLHVLLSSSFFPAYLSFPSRKEISLRFILVCFRVQVSLGHRFC